MTRHFGIPQPTRIEQAARLAEASWWPGDKPGALWAAKGELRYEPSVLTWALALSIAFMGGWLSAAAGLPLP